MKAKSAFQAKLKQAKFCMPSSNHAKFFYAKMSFKSLMLRSCFGSKVAPTERFRSKSLSPIYFRHAKAAIIVFDVSQKVPFRNVVFTVGFAATLAVYRAVMLQ